MYFAPYPPVSAVVIVSREASGAVVVAGGAVVGRVRSRCTEAGAGRRLNAWDIPWRECWLER